MDVVLTPMRRRHLRAVLHTEEQVYPKPWSMALFLSELAPLYLRKPDAEINWSTRDGV